MNNLDLSGKILFKVKLDNEIKKLMIHNDDLNYNDLILMLQRIFSNKIKQNDEFTIKYTDDENDLITITDDSDVSLALQTSKILKLTIFLKDHEQETQAARPEDIVSELKQIRQSIDKFLSSFGKTLKLENKIEDLAKGTDDLKIVHQVNPEVQKEFDPLNKKAELNNSHFQKQSRAQTPDSIGSSEMSGSITPRLQQHQQFHQAHPQIHPQYQPQAPQVPQQQVHQPQGFMQNPQQITQQQQQPQQTQPHPGMGTPGQFMQNTALKPPSQISFPGQTHQQQQQQPQVMPGQQQGMPQQQQQQHQVNPQMDQQQYYQQQQQQHHHYQQPGMPQQQVQGMPQQAQGLPQQAQGLQQQAQGLPQKGAGMPQQVQDMAQMPMSMSPGMNPYSKNPNVSLARPPSATFYQQGYR